MSEQPKWTPGPWVLEIDGGWQMVRSTVKDGDGHSLPVADLYHGGYDLIDLGYSSEATARLIAAAPELFEALRICVAMAGPALKKSMNLKGQSPFDIATAALAKARGESPDHSSQSQPVTREV